MIWLVAIVLLILVILFFPIRFHLHFLKIGEDEADVSLKLWRWELWKSNPVEESVKSQGDSSQDGNDQMESPAIPKAEPLAPQAPSPTPLPSTSTSTSPSSSPSSSPSPSPSSSPSRTDPNRPLYALALHPKLEKEALRLLYRILRNAWRIFKLRIPTMRVHYGMENPAQLGMIVGGFWGIHGVANAPEGWEFVPAWDKPGLSALQSHAHVTITVFRILRFLLLSLFAMIRFGWITWRIYKQYKADPRMSNLAAWRRWILQKLAPLVEEVQNDQA